MEVDEDNVRLSQFVRKIFGSFENGRAFYEFSQQECFPACRKVIIIPDAKVYKVNIYCWT